jgi:hypothetical protein
MCRCALYHELDEVIWDARDGVSEGHSSRKTTTQKVT